MTVSGDYENIQKRFDIEWLILDGEYMAGANTEAV